MPFDLDVLLNNPPLNFTLPGSWLRTSLINWNTSDPDMRVIGTFLTQFKPMCMIECGTFEGRGTEFFASLLPQGAVLHTIDLPRMLDHINTDFTKVTYQDYPEYDDMVGVRTQRIQFIKAANAGRVDVLYYDGLSSVVLEQLAQQCAPDFVYHDACHLPAIQMEDFYNIKDAMPVGAVVCFDDASQPFVEWFRQDYSATWHIAESKQGRGQLWAVKKG